MSDNPAPQAETQATDTTVGELIGRLSEQTSQLVRDEMRLATAELKESAKRAGMGAGLFGAAGVLALYGLGALVLTAIAALALAVDAWLAALIVGVVLFALAGIAALIGKGQVSKVSPKPERAIASVKQDVEEVKESRNRVNH